MAAEAGTIDDAVAQAANIYPGRILLPKGWHDAITGGGKGEMHIQMRHGHEISGDVANFVADIAHSFSEIRMGDNGALLLLRRDFARMAKRDPHPTLVLALRWNPASGYEVITAGRFTAKYLENRYLLWSKGAHHP